MVEERTIDNQLDEFVTATSNWAINGNVTARDNEMLKMAVFSDITGEIAGRPTVGNAGAFAILSDEGPNLHGQGAAPLPLQYFLAGIAF
jgi:hypothetical protein